MKQQPFKTCTNCGHIWSTLEDFLADPSLRLAGYQAAFQDLFGGLFLFSHISEGCYTTLAVKVGEFTSLSEASLLQKQGIPAEDCPEDCMREGSLESCPKKCECNWVREIMQTIKEWPKTEIPA